MLNLPYNNVQIFSGKQNRYFVFNNSPIIKSPVRIQHTGNQYILAEQIKFVITKICDLCLYWYSPDIFIIRISKILQVVSFIKEKASPYPDSASAG